MGLKCKRAMNRLMHKAKVTMAERMGVIAISQQEELKGKPKNIETKPTEMKVNVPMEAKSVIEELKTPNNAIQPPKKVILLPKR